MKPNFQARVYKMVRALLIRRLWLVQNRIFPTISFLVILPALLHICITLVMKNILVRSINEIPYESWVFPGIIMIISAVSLFPNLYRDLFDLRVHGKALISMTLAPVSKLYLIAGFLITACLESLVFVITGIGILGILSNFPLSVTSYFLITIYAIGFSAILGNLMITFSLITNRITTYLMTILIMFILILFGSGILVEFEFYSYPIGLILQKFPTSMILSSLRALIFYERFDWLGVALPFVITIAWTWLNAGLFRRKLRQ